MKKYYKIIIVWGLLLIAIFGCNPDFLEIDNPNSYSEASYFKTQEQVGQALTAAYASFYFNGLMAREWYFIGDGLGNDIESAPAMVGTGGVGQFPPYVFDNTNDVILELWRSLYRMALRASLTIEKTNEWETVTDAEATFKTHVIGEASFLKAWAYFTLVRFWGAVPLRKTFADFKAANFERAASEQDIYDFVMQNIEVAISNLPVVYDDPKDLGRVTRGAALALRGQMKLYQKNWSGAETDLAAIGQPPYTYDLVANFDDNFTAANENNAESVFEVQHAYNLNTVSWSVWYMFSGQEDWAPSQAITGRAMEYGWNDWANPFVSDAAVAAFTYSLHGSSYVDPRAALTFYGDSASGGDTTAYCADCPGNVKPYPFMDKGYRSRKYNRYEIKEQEGQPESDINTRIIRYADVLLWLAEARIEQDKLDAATLELINRVRRRVGAAEYELADISTKTNATTILRRERQIELWGEQERYFDLVRWGILLEALNPEKSAAGYSNPVQEKHYKLPIPVQEMDLNKLMVNNRYSLGYN